MPVHFIERNIGRDIDEDNCYDITGYVPEDIIGISGGLCDSSNRHTTIRGKYPIMKINIRTDNFSCSREANFEDGVINNTFLKTINPQNGWGLKVLESQVFYSRILGFKTINCFALGDYNVINKWNGYYTWARMGFLMADFEEEKFNAFLLSHKRIENTLFELVLNDTGKQLWIHKGYSWFGYFDLSAGSMSLLILEEYKKEKLP